MRLTALVVFLAFAGLTALVVVGADKDKAAPAPKARPGAAPKGDPKAASVKGGIATREGKPRRFAGRYALEGNLLFLGGGSGTLIGRVEMNKQGGINFALLDGGPVSSGLDFDRDGQGK